MSLEIFLADFAVFRVFLRISRVRDRAKYQKPCLRKLGELFTLSSGPPSLADLAIQQSLL